MQNSQKIIYVTREIERAMGIEPNENYLIVSNKTPYGEMFRNKYPDFVTLIDCPPNALLGTTELLNDPKTRALISDSNTPCSILVFKNTLRVEAAVTGNGWKILNPKSSLSERVENKISQIRWLGDLGMKYLPPHTIKLTKTIIWKNDPFIIQWSHGHTGDGTLLIRTREDLGALQEKFPERMARLTNFITGPSFTINAVVTPTRVIPANISYQITGLPPFTDNEFSTIGNDWGITSSLLSDIDRQTINSITNDIGKRLQSDGWLGLFGVDFIKDEKTKRIYLIEINARQPASSTFESSLQEEVRKGGDRGLTTFEAHLRALLGLPIDQDIIKINDGAQILQRITKNVQSVFDDVTKSLEKEGFNVILYQNTTPNSDLLRIQNKSSIMEGHKMLNSKGRDILNIIKSSHFNIEV